MVGELDVAIADQHATIGFLKDHVVFRFDDFKSARLFANRPLPSLKPVGKLLSFGAIGLKVQVGKRKAIELFPKPGFIVRWLSPAIRDMVGASEK